jgi:hypothetical protein
MELRTNHPSKGSGVYASRAFILLTGQGPSQRHEIWYFAEARRGARLG